MFLDRDLLILNESDVKLCRKFKKLLEIIHNEYKELLPKKKTKHMYKKDNAWYTNERIEAIFIWSLLRI